MALRVIRLAVTLLLSMMVVTPVLAGPPLLCWPYDIGDAPSLPMGKEGWRDIKGSYDVRNLVSDTLGLLAPRTEVVVRMETLRRAAVYAGQDGGLAKDLLTKLNERVETSGGTGKPDPLALFDAGYLIEAYRQGAWVWKVKFYMGGEDGYEMVLRAIALRGGDPQMELAAAIMSADRNAACPAACQRAHVRAALAGATEGSLLARNLVRQSRLLHVEGATLAELRESAGQPVETSSR